MARTINQIQSSMLQELNKAKELEGLQVLTDSEKTSLSDLNSTSKVAVWRLFMYVVAVSVWLIEKSFDLLKIEVEKILSLLKPHGANWYREKTLKFQYGYSLKEKDYYDNSALTTLEIKNSKVVKYAAVVEINSKLFIKVAGEKNGERAQLTPEQEEALTLYLKLVRDAGVKIEVVNRKPDLLSLEIDAYYNPLELDSQGARIDGTDNEPLQNGIRQYLKEFEFNGELVLTKLTDHLQTVKGIRMPKITNAMFKYGNQKDWTPINETYQTDAGHMKIEELKINWIARDV